MTHTINRFQHSYQIGLSAFIFEIEQWKPEDGDGFKSILSLGLTRFGMTASALSVRLNHSKGAISRWMNSSAMPSQAVREITVAWILSEAKAQLYT